MNRRELFTLMLGFILQRHPHLASAQVLIQRLSAITVTV